MSSVIDRQRSGEYSDVIHETAEGIAEITIDRPERHDAFKERRRPELDEFSRLP